MSVVYSCLWPGAVRSRRSAALAALDFKAGKFSLILLLAHKFLLRANEISIKLMSTLHRQQLLSAVGGVNDQSRVYCNDNDAISCQRDGANRLNPTSVGRRKDPAAVRRSIGLRWRLNDLPASNEIGLRRPPPQREVWAEDTISFRKWDVKIDLATWPALVLLSPPLWPYRSFSARDSSSLRPKSLPSSYIAH